MLVIIIKVFVTIQDSLLSLSAFGTFGTSFCGGACLIWGLAPVWRMRSATAGEGARMLGALLFQVERLVERFSLHGC